MLSAMPVDETVECRSLAEESWMEALRERWYQSERAGRDVGESAIRHWVHRHWPGFLRARWIEHMLGERFWIELGRGEFGILRDTPVDLRPLLDAIIAQLKCGAENLDILCWARRKSCDEKDAVRELLRFININAHRFRCHFADD
jgi:hypothetical protein